MRLPSSGLSFFCICFKNSTVPELATVPISLTRSSLVMPPPESSIERVCFLESSSTVILKLASGSRTSVSVSILNRILLRASEALEISSRRNTSGWVYREFTMRCSSCFISALYSNCSALFLVWVDLVGVVFFLVCLVAAIVTYPFYIFNLQQIL